MAHVDKRASLDKYVQFGVSVVGHSWDWWCTIQGGAVTFCLQKFLAGLVGLVYLELELFEMIIIISHPYMGMLTYFKHGLAELLTIVSYSAIAWRDQGELTRRHEQGNNR